MFSHLRTIVPKPWLRRIEAGVHPLLVAATLASLTLFAEQFGALAWLDAIMLRVMAPYASAEGANVSLDASQFRVTTILIPSTLYHSANGFQGRSPLDPGKLRPIFKEIEAVQPQAVVVDLQLEPGLTPCQASVACNPAYDSAVELGQGPYVLPLPVSRDDRGNAASFAWVKKLCAQGAHFGSPEVRDHLGKVVRFDHAAGSLAGVALSLLEPKHKGAHESDEARPSVCEQAQERSDLIEVLAAAQPKGRTTTEDSEPFHPSALRQVLDAKLDLRICSDGQTYCVKDSHDQIQPLRTALEMSKQGAGAKPWVVVIGGDFDQRDQFTLMSLREPGPVVHAATLLSSGRVKESEGIAFVVDIVIGCIAVLPISMAVALSGCFRKRITKRIGTHGWLFLPVHAFTLVLIDLIPWLVPTIFMAILLNVASYMLDSGTWLNPGPMLLGLTIHTLMESRAENPHNEPHEFPALLRAHPKLLISLLLTGAAITTLILHALSS